MEIMFVRGFLTHTFHQKKTQNETGRERKIKKRSGYLLLVLLTHLWYNTQIIQSTAEKMVCAVMLCYFTMLHLKVDSFLIFSFSLN